MEIDVENSGNENYYSRTSVLENNTNEKISPEKISVMSSRMRKQKISSNDKIVEQSDESD